MAGLGWQSGESGYDGRGWDSRVQMAGVGWQGGVARVRWQG